MSDAIKTRKGGRKIVMLTAYDVMTARLLSAAGVDIILVGDSLGEVFQGKTSTREVTMEEMLYHTAAVARGTGNSGAAGGKVELTADMPIRSYDTQECAIANARLLLAAGAGSVKLEGYHPGIARAITEAGIGVMGHLGLLPQTALARKVVARTPEEAARLKADALALAAEGAFAIVLECIPESLAREITETVNVPTIGIGAGKFCDGQVLVINDLIGLDPETPPKFVKRYADLASEITRAVRAFRADVERGAYPDDAHTYH
jgi:3-methyl-2-oxobutanoate hydroxymethyltransferase